MQSLCFLQHLGNQLQKRSDDEEQQTETALERLVLIETDKYDDAVLIEQGISASYHISNIISIAIKHRLFAGN